ncbi:MAG: hypothetical protein QOH49_506 [Acidobacteriota bacterium]|jgi:hypothetical protein|nr:hypothetical protein [Acidobacteriota bacterium]
MSEEDKVSSAGFPSVVLAYPLALASYDQMQKRMDVVENRLQTLLGFTTTLTLALIAAVSGKAVSFQSGWFYAGLAFFGLGEALGVYAKLSGSLQVLSPATLYREWLTWGEWEFKKNMVFWAGEAYAVNKREVNRKGNMASMSAILFLLEAAGFAVWLARA